MQKHIKNFREHYKLAQDEIFMCQYCNEAPAVDIHHIAYRSQKRDDSVSNLIGLCRLHHDQAHFKSEPYLTEQDLLDCKSV